MPGPSTDPAAEPQRCSAVAREQGEAPAGTATAAELALVEVPLPWPADVAAAPGYPPGVAAALERLAAAGHPVPSVYGVVPEPDAAPAAAPPGAVRLVTLRAVTTHPAVGTLPALGALRRREWYLDPGDVAEALERAFSGPADGEGPAEAPRELYLCTHGSRDSCCARLGLPLHRQLAELPAVRRGELRLRRVSHLGGHRFAPTLLELPSGRLWGHLTPAAATELVEGTAGERGPSRELLAAHRGRVGLAPAAQLVEAELFARHGRAWDGASLAARVQAQGPGWVEVRIDHALAGSPERAAVLARVEQTGWVPTAGCGREPGRVPRLRVGPLRELVAAAPAASRPS